MALLLICAAASARSTAPIHALFYQPQLADRALPAARWPALFASVRARGFDTLVVQWVQYGDGFTAPADRAWLRARLDEARASGLQLVLGLAADPAFFQRQADAPEAVASYLQGLARRDVAVAAQWQALLGATAIAGWYLPLEIDDQHWRAPEARRALTDALTQEVRGLRALAPLRPVYVTAFFSGRMAPAAHAQLLADVHATGVRVWVQDGAGTAQLAASERALYLAAADGCAGSPAQGRVHEIFAQVPGPAAFAAQPLPPAALDAALAQHLPCAGDRVVFELRYLPEAADLLVR
jgi:hypothetical protein